METPSAPQVRRCCQCGEVKPIEQYRLRQRSTGLRHGDCQDCHRQWQRDYRATLRERAVYGFLAEVHHRRDRGVERIGIILSAMIERVGGMNRLINMWVESFETARREKRAAAVCRNVLGLFELSRAYSQVQNAERREELRHASPEELAEQITEGIVEMLVEAGDTDEAAREIVSRLGRGCQKAG